MNLCKVILAQVKATKSDWLTARGGGAGRVRFQGAKKRLDNGEDTNDVVANAVKPVLTANKCKKSKSSSYCGSEEE